MPIKKILLALCGFAFLLPAVLSAKTELDTASTAPDWQAIINGELASTTTYPWVVFFRDEFGEQYCGGSLIAPTWILSAGHCFLNPEGTAPDLETAARSTVVLGSDTVSPLGENAIVGQIGQIIIHPNYQPDFETSPNSEDFDLALVEITAAVDLQPVSLPVADTVVPAGTTALVLGWGTTRVDENNESADPSNELLQAQQAIVSGDACAAIYGDRITGNMICAGGLDAADTTDTCQGDSGGPLVIVTAFANVQVGASSFGGTETGPTCGEAGTPGVYANIAALTDFVSGTVAEANFVSLDAPAAPTPPVISAAVEGTTVTISWTAYQGASGYTLYYAPFPAQTPISNLDVGSVRTVSGDLPAGSAFYIAVQPYNESGVIDVLSNVATFSIPGSVADSGGGTTDPQTLTVAQVEAACTGDIDVSPTEQSLQFTVDGSRAIFRGVLDATAPQKVSSLLADNPEVRTIVLAYGPGSDDDVANLEAALLINEAGLGTCVPDGGEISSGAVDFYLAGAIRRLGENTFVGVHSWAAGDGTEGSDLPMSDPEHQRYLDYYQSIGVSSDFYWFTLQAAPAADIHKMTPAERLTYAMETP